MENLEVKDYTGSLFASHFMYVAPMVGWYQAGDTYEITSQHMPLGQAVCMGLTVYKLHEITSNMTQLATGMMAKSFQREMYLRFNAEGNTPMAVMIMAWKDMDCAMLKALMEMRFERIKGQFPYKTGVHQKLELEVAA